MAEKPRTILLLSGGMNSAVMLYDILTFKKAEILDCMIFDNFQPREDIACARALCEKAGVTFSLWDIGPTPIMSTTNLDSPETITKEFAEDLRNTCFMQMLVAAVRWAKLAGADTVTTGLLDEDVAFEMMGLLGIFEAAAQVLDDYKLKLNTPLWTAKRWEVFKLAEDLNRVAEVLGDTYSCLNGDTDIQHQWGYGCGSCDGCVRRWRAWEEHLERKKA
jgi:7-cyano-7-deazaguanine synthase in queuosine biosynthesis